MPTKSNFKCDRCCGKCCRVLVQVDKEDISRISKLGYEYSYFLEGDIMDEKNLVLRMDEKGCIFLKKDKKGRYSCSIYKNRPKTCRKYPFFNKKPIKSCYPEILFPIENFSYKAWISKQNKQ